jgi:hypothetical protein
MKTINSLSGGKTSSYMAVHYPADYNIFALVTIEAEYCKPKDKSIVKYASDKLGKEFIATAESDKTLYVMRDLEQLLGKEITWVSGDSFEQVCLKKKALPNLMMRFCTTEMKIKPIFEWWQNNFNGEKIDMNIGFRYDEKERGYDKKGKKKKEKPFKHIIGKNENGTNKWQETQWRDTYYPLINLRVTHSSVAKWAESTSLVFPPDSNCVGCFWKHTQQLRKNWEDETLKMRWFSELEQKMKRRFKKEMTFEQVKQLGLQQDFFFGTGSGCNAGFCTD